MRRPHFAHKPDTGCSGEVDVGRHKVDIALLRDGKPVSGVEIRDTHPVNDVKWDALKKLGFPCIEVEAKDVIRMWEYDINIWRQQFLGLSLPMRLDLKAVTHNLFHFNDQLHRIYCEECDDGVDRQEEDGSIPEEVRVEILNEMDRQVPRLLARELSSILQFHSKSRSKTANEECEQSDTSPSILTTIARISSF